MNKSILILSASMMMLTITLLSCDSSSQKVQTAEERVAEANNDLDKANDELDKANQEHWTDVETFKKITSEKIDANNQKIAEFKERVAKEEKITREEFAKLVADVEQKNRDLQEKLNNYKADGKGDWELFKAEFSRDMDELGKAFKDVTVKNVK